ncbi:MAG: hypothetical protein C0511_05330 [Hyphomicrobium sp.]|nr:hypothetical protein [Hyphomicrobium sp.]PPC82846.1 MAG: hypothetical protein CTY40_03905 [Hyphomicrobium sp.]
MSIKAGNITAGLDIGGAHLKVALAHGGRVVAAEQFVCPLWQGLDRLDAALAAARPLTTKAQLVGITMTGELSDVFENRRQGVETLVRRLTEEFGTDTRFWIGPNGFGSATDAVANHALVGSTNFLATAALVGRQISDALVVDFGSTTTDIVPVLAGAPSPRGLTDAKRQATGELVYTGYTRTAVMGIAQRAPMDGQWVTLAREYLATMADVRRILGADLAEVDLHATADGKGKTQPESLTRFARMLGRDASDAPTAAWLIAAGFVQQEQMRSIEDGVRLVLSAHHMPAGAPIIAAGIGAEAFDLMARALGRPWMTFGALVAAQPDVARKATWSAPAAALAVLLASVTK